MENEMRGNKGMTYFHGEYESDPNGLLAMSIIMQAIADWRFLVKKRAWEIDYNSRYCSFDEMRNFFRGDWCAMLLIKTEWSGERILELLEAELQEAMQKPKKKGRKRKNEHRSSN